MRKFLGPTLDTQISGSQDYEMLLAQKDVDAAYSMVQRMARTNCRASSVGPIGWHKKATPIARPMEEKSGPMLVAGNKAQRLTSRGRGNRLVLEKIIVSPDLMKCEFRW